MRKLKLTSLEKQWVLYDVGNSAFVLMVSTIIPIYFKNIAESAGVSMADSTAYFSYAISLTTIVTALLGPILGTLADTKGFKKPLFALSLILGVAGCAGLALPVSWTAFLGIFIAARMGYNGSLVFYDAMLTDVTEDDRMDQVSSEGYAWGYLGSCIPFIGCLLLVLFGDKLGLGTAKATSLAFLLVAVWWLFMAVPILKNHRQRFYAPRTAHPVKESFSRLVRVFADVKKNPKVFWFLAAFFFYIDGVYTIIDLATSYGKDVGISDTNLLLALLLTQIVAFPFAILFGRLTEKYKSSSLIQICILGYAGIAIFALQLDKAWEFWFLAVCVAVFQGAVQALSRSYFARIIPKDKASEYFGFYDIFGKGAAFMGTMLMGVSTQLFDTSRAGVGMLALMFFAGFFMFRKVVRMEES